MKTTWATAADGVFIAASGVSLGGTASGAGNLISGNGEYGVEIESEYYGVNLSANDNVVEGNLIGTDVTGTLPLGNGFGGVAVFGGEFGAAGNSIGGTATGAGKHHRVQRRQRRDRRRLFRRHLSRRRFDLVELRSTTIAVWASIWVTMVSRPITRGRLVPISFRIIPT